MIGATYVVGTSAHQVDLKAEDTLLIAANDALLGTLVAVFDGHNGPQAARFCTSALTSAFASACADSSDPEHICKGLVSCALYLQREWAQTKLASGCTATILHLRGAMATVATLGDSLCYIDTGSSCAPMSVSHRLGDNAEEMFRLQSGGVTVARMNCSCSGPAGPGEYGLGALRVWPAGLAVSRAIGNYQGGSSILAYPHVQQVMLPPGGARFVLASDGIWDALHPSRACQLIRSTPLASASEHLAEVALKLTGPLDDMTAVVVDVLYPGTTFAELAAQRAQQQGVGLGTSSTGSSKTLVDLSMPRVPSYADSLTEEGCSGSDSPSSIASSHTTALTMRKSKSLGCFGALRSRAKKVPTIRTSSIDGRQGAGTAASAQQQALAAAGVKLLAGFDSFQRYGQSQELQQALPKGSGLGSGRVTQEVPVCMPTAAIVPPVAS